MKLILTNAYLGILFSILFVLSASADPTDLPLNFDQEAKKGVSVELINGDTSILVRMGKIAITLPARPIIEDKDLPPGVSLENIQREFEAQFLALSDNERLNYYENRMTFLKITAEFFNGIKYGVAGLNFLIDGTMATSKVIKKTLGKLRDYSKTKLKKAWNGSTPVQDLPGAQLESLLNEDNSVDPTNPVDLKKRTDLINKVFIALNKIFYQNAKLVSQAVEFGFTIGLGISGNVGYKDKSKTWAFGGLTDLLLHVSYRPASNTYILNLQSLNEIAKLPLTKISIVGGIDVRIGCHFKDSKQASIFQGHSSYPSNGIFGVSIYDDRLITWLVTEINPLILSDLSGFSTSGIAINLMEIEGNKLYPLLFKASKTSLFGQVFHFIKDSVVSERAANKCENLLL